MNLGILIASFITDLKSFFRSKATLFWTLAFPIMLILIFGAIFTGVGNAEYELKVVESESKDTMVYNFEVIWEDMPVILQSPKYAIESMYYILTDEEYKKMLNDDSDEYSDEIINYWKKEDPSKFTPYNESMTEYFRRVDYAIFNFKTLNEANGVKTDRGKIYILYGPATSTERNLTENKALEIWKYAHLKKIFIFETLANDVFKLIDIKSY